MKQSLFPAEISRSLFPAEMKQRGQILIIILLVLVVSLSIVLSLVSRSVTDVRTSATTEQSNRAYFAAEAGVEQALKQLKDDPYYTGTIAPTNPFSNQANFTTTVSPSGGTTPFAFPSPFVADNPAQVNLLNNYQCLSSGSVASSCSNSGSYMKNSDRMYVYWGDDNYSDANTATEITFIYENGGTYGVAKVAYDTQGSSRGNSFSTRVDGSYLDSIGSFNSTCDNLSTQLGTKNYKHCQEIIFNQAGVPTGATLYLARIRLLYNTQAEPIAVAPKSGTSLPAQGSEIVSTGSIPGGATRKLKVFRSFPSLPGIFDYVLFNGSSNPLSK